MSGARENTAYDVCGPLPTGTTLLEASAGTGKTFTIATLATRLVAEGHAELSELLLVTFSRAATRELRERVREHLVAAHRTETGDRRHRLGRALSSFDAATIATTHGFCEQVLHELGVVADFDAGGQLTEDVTALADEVARDLYLQRYATAADTPPIAARSAAEIVRAAVADPHATLRPAGAAEGSPAGARFGIADDARREVDRRKRTRRVFDYDDLLLRLRDALADPVTGEAACRRLRERYRWVLVDEFQDTDPVQWEIVRRAFHGHTTLVLIGDPKQAIYAFRGADVYSYLDASAQAGTHRDLARNWRSDLAVVAGLDHLFAGAELGDPRIVARPVDAQHEQRRLRGAPADAGLRLRVIPRQIFGTKPDDTPAIGPVRDFVARDLAADIAALLASGATLTLDGETRPITPGDIAVLVRQKPQPDLVRDALTDAGIPAVVTGARSVFLSQQAKEWLVLLRALEQPHRGGLVRAAALTSFVGWDAGRLAECPDDEIDELTERVRDWRDLLTTRGVAALHEAVWADGRVPERLLALRHGERLLTDLRHVGQALHGAMSRGDFGATGAVEWLQRQIADAQDDQSEERSQRLETDAHAVQILTIHTSKGLEFPVVYVPFGWDRYPKERDPFTFHDGSQRVLWVGGSKATGYREASRRHADEEAGEELRLLYVALTRAQCQAVTWWAATKKNTTCSAMHRLLFGRGEGGALAAKPPVPSDDVALQRLAAWAAAAPAGAVAVETARQRASEPASGAVGWADAGATVPSLAVARLDRSLDRAWRRTSYSALTARAHDAGVASEPEDEERRDEPAVPTPPAGPVDAEAESALRAIPSPMADLPSGTTFGTVVHGVLEAVDTTAADLVAELQGRCGEALAGRLATPLDPEALADALLPVLRTPLGPLAGGRALADIAPRDRLAELEFELPLLGGDQPRAGAVALAQIAELLRTHLPAGDPLAGYADRLADPALAGPPLRGYLTGSIDAVLRVDGPRYLVVDYKTNWLGGYAPGGPLPLPAYDYRTSALAAAMMHAHYPLQALLYAVALHRYLRWRQPGYDPETHLGGVLYLFLRGMCGPQSPVLDGMPTGVFSWRPPAELIVALSALLDRGVDRDAA